MGLNWPGSRQHNGNMTEAQEVAVRQLVDSFAERVSAKLSVAGLALHASPLWKPWNGVFIQDAEKVICVFSHLSGGVPALDWVDRSSEQWDVTNAVQTVQQELGIVANAVVVLPLPGFPGQETLIEKAALQHVSEVERTTRLASVGDLKGVEHLEPYLRTFLDQHPDPNRNVFVMMRFLQSKQLDEAYAAVKETLASRGFHAVRADDRDYTGELWSNIEVYLTCCNYGIAIIEDIESRDFNPNVSLELGYMLGRHKRCLILKEQRLPNLPADVVHRMYKPFDMFNVESSASREVARWVDVDLGYGLL